MSYRAAIYARVSTSEQNKPGLASIPHQIQQCQKEINQDQIPHFDKDIFVDDETGQISHRPGLGILLSRLSEYSHVYIYDATRLARRRSVALFIREQFSENNITLRLVHGDTSEMDEESRVFMESIQDAASEAEIIRFKRRARMGRERRADRGLHTGKISLGWRVIRDNNGHSIGIEHDHSYDRFFRDLEEVFLSGAPYARFPKLMAARGHISPNTGRSWSVTALKYILRNPINQGHIIFGWTTRPKDQWIVKRDSLPPRWNNIEELLGELERRNNLKGAARKQTYPFSGALRCSKCRWKMTVSTKNYINKHGEEKKSIRYRCSKREHYKKGYIEKDCEGEAITQVAVVEHLAKWWAQDDEEALNAYIAQLGDNNKGVVEEEIKALELRQAEINKTLNGLVDRLALAPENTLGTVRNRMEELANERAEIEDRLHLLRLKLDKMPNPFELKASIKAVTRQADNWLVELPPHEIQAKMHRLFPDGLWIKNGEVWLPLVN